MADSGNVTLERVFTFFQNEVQSSIDSLNSALDQAQGSSSSSSSSGSSSSSTSGTSSTSGSDSSSSSGTVGGVSSDPIVMGQITYLFQAVTTAMTTEANTMKALKDALSGMISTLR